MDLKEQYLTQDGLGSEVFRLRAEISQIHLRTREWNAAIDASALIVTDFQNYFLSEASHAFIPSAPAIISNINKLIGHFRKYRRPVIFTRHINDQANAHSMAWWWDDLIAEGSFASSISSEINAKPGETITKHQYDAFHETELESLLLRYAVRTPVICGVMTNLCCETTVRSAFVRGFRPVMPLDATAAYNRAFHMDTFRNLCFGFMPLRTTEEIIQELKP
jgi:nicotinamidase-related amidase